MSFPHDVGNCFAPVRHKKNKKNYRKSTNCHPAALKKNSSSQSLFAPIDCQIEIILLNGAAATVKNSAAAAACRDSVGPGHRRDGNNGPVVAAATLVFRDRQSQQKERERE